MYQPYAFTIRLERVRLMSSKSVQNQLSTQSLIVSKQNFRGLNCPGGIVLAEFCSDTIFWGLNPGQFCSDTIGLFVLKAG
jgi:hypothetical protein